MQKSPGMRGRNDEGPYGSYKIIMWLTACRLVSSQPECRFDVKHPMVAKAQSRVASLVARQERVIMVFWHERALAMPKSGCAVFHFMGSSQPMPIVG